MAARKAPRKVVNIQELLGIVPKRPATQEEISEHTANFNAFIEYYWNQLNKPPSMDRLKAEYPKIPEAQLKASLKVALIKMEAKGYNVLAKSYLSAEQMAVVNSLLNLADKRSNTKKLQACGVAPATLANWKKDPVFLNYWRERAETLLGNSIGDVHLALIESATAGDVSAIKLFYEITGRHTPGQQQAVNVQATLIRAIEAIQKHVTDPKILLAIANEIQDAGIIKGELMRGGD